MAKKLNGKVAIVTGASSGIGYAIAEGLAENGAKVLISSRSEKNIKTAVDNLRKQSLNVEGTVCDASKKQDVVDLVKKCIELFGRLDIVVSNAGIMDYFGPLVEIDDEGWDKHMNINLKSGFWLAREAVPHLEKTKGNIIFIGSTMAFEAFKYVGMYSITKTAILGLVKVLAVELASKHIRVNGVNPGATETSMLTLTHDSLAAVAQKNGESITSEQICKKILEDGIPLKRFADPKEMAGGVVFMASDDASYITGETLVIGGGCTTRL